MKRATFFAITVLFFAAALLSPLGCMRANRATSHSLGEAGTHASTESRQGALDIETLQARVEADPFSGIHRNNLGVALLQAGRLGEAAAEFDQARKLLPGRPDPRLNLGLTLERAGRNRDALQMYQSAHELDADYMPAKQALARILLLLSENSKQLNELLKEIALQGETQAWRDWARARLQAANAQTPHPDSSPLIDQ